MFKSRKKNDSDDDREDESQQLTWFCNVFFQEDYLKMSGRGAFFFRIVQTLNDESEEMKQLTIFYLQQRLLKRRPKIMYQHFIESIFHFNEYEVWLSSL